MGLYGSPDTGNLYSGRDGNYNPKKMNKFKIILIVVLVLYISIVALVDEKLVFIISTIGLASMLSIAFFFIKMIFNLFRRKSVNKDVIALFISVAVYAICSHLSIGLF